MNDDISFPNSDPRTSGASMEAGLGGLLWSSGASQSWGLCESLIARSRACRYQDPEQMVLLAERAVSIAEGLDPMEYGRELVADLRARAFAELGNAYRVADDLEAAERSMRRAVEWSSRGTQDPLLLARIMRLVASLRGAQRRFQEALDLLDAVYTIYECHGDRTNAGRTLISKGVYAGHNNEPEQAIRLLSAGLGLISPASDPKLVLSAVHNLVTFLVECERYAEARRILALSRNAYFTEGDRLNLIRLRWLEGRIAAGLGETEAAEAAFLETHREFEQVGLGYHTALVSLDLAAIWLEQHKIAETRELVEQMVASFRARRIARETLAALMLLRESLQADQESVELLQTVRGYLKKMVSRPVI